MANMIIPRWEWRTFQEKLGEAGDNIKKFEKGSTRESSEVYILSKESNNNTKIRDGLMDIKTLETMNNDKLELWEPVLKTGFPINRDSIKKVFEILKVSIPIFLEDEYEFDEYMSELIEKNENLLSVNVDKIRNGYSINNCIVEIAEISVNKEIHMFTAAVESENADKVFETVKELKLDVFENINYIKILKTKLKF